jgi:hypothetical protein
MGELSSAKEGGIEIEIPQKNIRRFRASWLILEKKDSIVKIIEQKKPTICMMISESN